MSLRPPPIGTLSTEDTLAYKSLLGPGVIEVAWDDEPATVRNPFAADRIAADVPVILEDRKAA